MDGELLSTVERGGMEDRLDGLRAAMSGADYLAIKAWIETVDEATRVFAGRRMDKHVRAAMAGHRVEEFASEARTTRQDGE